MGCSLFCRVLSAMRMRGPEGFRIITSQGMAAPTQPQEPSVNRSPTRRWWLVWVLTGLTAFVAWWLLRSPVTFDWGVFWGTFTGLDAGWLAASAGLALLSYVGRALRWAVFLAPLRPRPNLWKLLKANVIGFTLVVILGRAAELIRPYLIARNEGVPFATQVAAWFLERIYDLLFAMAVFGLALSQVDRTQVQAGEVLSRIFRVGGTVVWLVGSLCLILLILVHKYSDRMHRRLLEALGFLRQHHLARAERLADSLLKGVESTRSGKAVAQVVSYTALEWLLIGGCYFALMHAFRNVRSFSLMDVIILMGFIAFGSVVQLPGIGGGIQVAAAVVLRELFGVPLELAAGMALAIWAMTYVVVVPVGLPITLMEGLNWRQIRTLEEEAKRL